MLLFVYSLVSVLCAVTFSFNSLFLVKLFICLLFTPIFGYLILKISKNITEDNIIITHFFCRKCGLESFNDAEFCPSCMNEGQLTKLTACKMKLI